MLLQNLRDRSQFDSGGGALTGCISVFAHLSQPRVFLLILPDIPHVNFRYEFLVSCLVLPVVNDRNLSLPQT